MAETREDKRGQLLVGLMEKKVLAGSLTLDDANVLMDDYSYCIIEHIEAWPDKLHLALAQKLARKTKGIHGIGKCLFDNIERFKGVDKKEQKKMAIQLMRSGAREVLLIHGAFGKFKPFDWLDQEVALVVIEVGLGFAVAKFPAAFKNLDQKEIVWAMAKKCHEDIQKFVERCK